LLLGPDKTNQNARVGRRLLQESGDALRSIFRGAMYSRRPIPFSLVLAQLRGRMCNYAIYKLSENIDSFGIADI
jgi:hypothetical protein